MAKKLTMAEIQEKHEGVQDDSLVYVTPEVIDERPELERYKGKQVVQRECAESGEIFFVATSDLWQKRFTDDVMKSKRKERSKERRAEQRILIAAAKEAGL